ncbi:hypothetical protein ACFQZ8_16085 [Micromonospora azadirachtae]|uniref:IgA FC receptor n=1 Tax=Micromonospora azadirachtae TaxID=1970735 RepID=A0ABW3A3Y1_9ACTN
MVDSPSTPARSRPGVVTISSYLLILFAVLQLVGLVVTLSTISTIRDVMRDAYASTDPEMADAVSGITYAVGIGGAIFALLVAAGLVVLALLNNRGKNGSRITTWVLGGIMVCCTGGNLAGGAAGGFTGGATSGASGNAPSPDEIQRQVDAALPGWFNPLSTAISLIAVLALLASLILLALPQANAFFRKPQPGWEPPTPGAAYPGYPGYPQAPGQPGYPQAPGQPGYPQAPGQPGYPQGPGQPGYPSSGDPSYPPIPGQPPAGQPPTFGQPGDQPPSSDRPGPTPPPMS